MSAGRMGVREGETDALILTGVHNIVLGARRREKRSLESKTGQRKEEGSGWRGCLIAPIPRGEDMSMNPPDDGAEHTTWCVPETEGIWMFVPHGERASVAVPRTAPSLPSVTEIYESAMVHKY